MAGTTNNYSLLFDKSNSDYVSISNASQTGLDLTSGGTIMAWISGGGITLGGTSTLYTIASKLDSGGGYEVRLRGGAFGVPAQLEVFIREDASTTDTLEWTFSEVGYLSQTFVHIALVIDFSTLGVTLYANGIDQGTDGISNCSAIGSNTAEFAIGATSGGSNYFDNYVDEVKVYNSFLTETLVRYYMRENQTQTSLQGYWSFDNSLFDQTSNTNHLSIASGSPTYDATVPFITYGRTSRYYATAGDGYTKNTGGDGSFPTTLRSASASSAVNYTAEDLQLDCSRANFVSDHLSRVFIPINTTSYSSDPTIYDAYLGIYEDDNGVGGGGVTGLEIGLVQTTQASTTSLSTDDYDQCGDLNSPTEGMTRIDAYNPSEVVTYNFWRLNSVGRGWISAGDVTKLGLRYGHEIDNNWTDNTRNYNYFLSSENTTNPDYGPHLDIVDSYTSPDILEGASDEAEGTGGEERDPGGQGTPGYTPGGSGSANGGSSAGETALFFASTGWLEE